MRRLDGRGLAAGLGTLFGATFLLVGLGQLMFPSWGRELLDLAASIYPGYHGPNGLGSVLVVTLYGALDGVVAGAVLAWLYNRFAAHGTGEAP